MGLLKVFKKEKKKVNHRLVNEIKKANPEMSEKEVETEVKRIEKERKDAAKNSTKTAAKAEKTPKAKVDLKAQYKAEKEARRAANKIAREAEAKELAIKEAAEKAKQQEEWERQLAAEKAKLEEQAQKRKQEIEEKERLARERAEAAANKETFTDEDIYDEMMSPIERGSIVDVEVMGKEKDVWFVQALSNGQEIKLPVIELEGKEISVGDTLTIKIYKKYAGELIGSYRRYMNQEQNAERMANLDMTDVVTGTVESFRGASFTVRLSNGLTGKVFIRNIDDKFVDDAEPYIGKNFEFKIIDQIENDNRFQVELSRRAILNEQKNEIAKSIKEGQEISFDEFTWNKGGLETTFKGVRVFVPMKELSYKFFASVDDAANEITGPQTAKVIEIKNQRGRLDIVASIKALQQDPWEQLIAEIKVGDEFNGEVTRVERYGLFIGLNYGKTGLLHQSVMLEENKKAKKGDKINVVIEAIDLEKKTINVAPKVA